MPSEHDFSHTSSIFVAHGECFAYDTVSWKLLPSTFGTNPSQVRLETSMPGGVAGQGFTKAPSQWSQRFDFLWDKEMRFKISTCYPSSTYNLLPQGMEICPENGKRSKAARSHLLDLPSSNLDIQSTRNKTGQTRIWLTVLLWKLPDRVFPHLHVLWLKDNALPIVE